jgi:PAS domain-containing protein
VDLLLYPEDQMRLAGELPPLPWPVHSVLFEQVRRHGHYRAEHRLALRGGGYRHHLIEAVLLHSAQGKEEGAVITGADIGPLKQQEAELLASDARFRDAESVAHLGSWELDPVDERMKWSAETRRLLRASPDTEPTLAALFSAIHPEDRLSSARAFMEALAARRSCDLEFRIDTPTARCAGCTCGPACRRCRARACAAWARCRTSPSGARWRTSCAWPPPCSTPASTRC